MEELSQAQKDKIIKTLIEKGAINNCPRCNNKGWTVIGGYFNQTIQLELQGIIIGGPSIPSAVVVCTKCGFLSQHALGVLGLMPDTSKKQEENNE